MNDVAYLLLSDSRDFTTDYIALELEKRGRSYLRLNRDQLHHAAVAFYPKDCELSIIIDGRAYMCSEYSLRGVYYRAPTYLRETFSRDLTPEDQLRRSQWISFYRNLTCFSHANWVNCPNATFRAENKMAQLRQAVASGFPVPDTVVTNTTEALREGAKYAIKTLDTVVFNLGNREGFVYTSCVDQDYLVGADLSLAPVVAQNFLRGKIDLRVTVIGNVTYAVKIVLLGMGIEGDWRLEKNTVDYVPVSLPADIENKCVDVVREMGLVFAGVDLALVDDEYVFIELNPTGEWAWLVDAASQNIFRDICDCLEGR